MKGANKDQQVRADTACNEVLFLFMFKIHGEQVPLKQRKKLVFWSALTEDGRDCLLVSVKTTALISSTLDLDTHMTWTFLAMFNART